jgi:phage terminase large subunit-like protein
LAGAVLAELKHEMGPIAFSAQYQQSPVPPGGTIIKRKWLTPYDTVTHRSGDSLIISWDIALSEAETGDYSAGVVLLKRNEVYFVLEVVRGKFPSSFSSARSWSSSNVMAPPPC